MRLRASSNLVFLALWIAAPAAPSAAILSRSGPIDKPPAHTNHWCPLTLPTFVADGTEVTVVFTADTFRDDGFWRSQTFDNISLVALPVYNANVSAQTNCTFDCFGNALMHQQVPLQDLIHFESFDASIDPAWNLSYGGYFGAGGNTTRGSAMTVIGDCNSRTGGWLGVGRKSDTHEYASAKLTIGGLTPGQSYVLSYWHAAISGLHWVDVYGAGFVGPYLCDIDEFVATGVTAGDAFGQAVDAQGDVAVIGFPSHGSGLGAVAVYRNLSGQWHEEQTLLPLPGTTGSFGAAVAVFDDLIAIGAPGDDDHGLDAGAVFIYRFDAAAGLWNVEDKLTFSDGVAGDQMGSSVDLDGVRVVAGAPTSDEADTDAGLAINYRFDGSIWTDEQRLVPTPARKDDHFGTAVALAGGALAVGAPDHDAAQVDQGAVQLFRLAGTLWVGDGELAATVPEANAHFGAAVTLSNGRLAVGAPDEDVSAENAGGVYTYEHGAAWTLFGRIISTNAATDDGFGSSVAMLDEKLLVGAAGDGPQGTVHLFGLAGPNWGPVDEFAPPPTSTAHAYGSAVALTDQVAVVGAPTSDAAGVASGAAFVRLFGADCNGNGAPDVCDIAAGSSFDIDCDGFPDECVAPQLPRQLDKLLPNDAADDDQFGEAVDADGDVIVVGSRLHDHPSDDDGSATVYRFDGTSYVFEQELRADDGAAGDWFGRSVAVSGNWLAVGAHRTDDLGNDSGSVYMFWYDGVAWQQVVELWAGDGGNDTNLGRYVALDGDVLVASAALPQTGQYRRPAAYVFEATGPVWSQTAKLTPSTQETFENLGHPVAVDAGRIALGSEQDNNMAGVAYVYEKNGFGSWTTSEVVLPPGGGATFGGFGVAVALGGDVLVVGAESGTNPQVFDSGAYLYRYGSGTWNFETLLNPPSTDRFSTAIAVEGDLFVGGVPLYFGKQIEQGAAYAFRYDGLSWNEEAKLTHADYAPVDRLAQAVAIAGDVVVVGCSLDDDDGNASGSAYVFGAGEDCNLNGIPDGLDILAGTSDDSDLNGIPDDCDTPVDEGPSRREVRLLPNVPNPFNPATVLRFDLPDAGRVRLSLYDMAGRRVRTLVDDRLGEGRHAVTWHGRDDHDRLVASGVYLVVLETAHGRVSHKMALVR